MSYRWIRASEVDQYAYCRRSWWLRRLHGAESANVRQLERGTRHHERHNRQVANSFWLRRLAYVALFAAVAALALTLLTG